MDRIWANRLEAGAKAWTDVPEKRRESVKVILREDVVKHIITPEQYERITGEPYVAVTAAK